MLSQIESRSFAFICTSLCTVSISLLLLGVGSDRWPREPKGFTFYVEPMDGGDAWHISKSKRKDGKNNSFGKRRMNAEAELHQDYLQTSGALQT